MFAGFISLLRPRLRAFRQVSRGPAAEAAFSSQAALRSEGSNGDRLDAGAEAPALQPTLLSRLTHRRLHLRDRRRIPFAGERLRLRSVQAHGQIERSLRGGKPVGFHVLSGTFVLEIEVK